ncbi:hypothetical protein QTP86_005378 [Hemibagrus guttatus]|nr:hypothetical protein QTP86_005378 [Hemibagrus guttatus]
MNPLCILRNTRKLPSGAALQDAIVPGLQSLANITLLGIPHATTRTTQLMGYDIPERCRENYQGSKSTGLEIKCQTDTGGHGGLVVSTFASHLQGWGFDSRLCHVCVEFACSPRPSGVFSGYSGFLPQSKDMHGIFMGLIPTSAFYVWSLHILLMLWEFSPGGVGLEG